MAGEQMATAAAPRVSVVVPTFQRREVVMGCMRALAAQEDAGPFEVIVVVDGSTDGTAAALGGLKLPIPLTVLEQPNRGRSAACNRGAESAQGELLLFLDDDMVADPRLIAEHLRAHAEGADVVLGHIPLHPGSPRNFLSESVAQWADERGRELSLPDHRIELDEFLTGQMSIARAVFAELGGFDLTFTREGTFGCEDFDLGWRLMKTGRRIVFNPDAISRQRYVVSPRRHLEQWRQNGTAKVLLARKHPEEAARILWRRERRADRYLLRHLRVPLRELILLLLRTGCHGPRTVHWFRRVRDLEYFAGVRSASDSDGGGSVRVLCYHSLTDLRGRGIYEPYGIPAARFRRQVRFLRRWFSVIDADGMRAFLTGAGVPRRAVLVTFDDCFADLLEVGLPILRETGTPAVAFAVSGLLGRTNEWDSAISDVRLPLLDDRGLRELAAQGVTVAAHSRSHRMLSKLTPEEIETEIDGSLRDLEAAGLEAPAFFAYPHGEFDDRVRRAAAAAGLAGAFTTRPGVARAGGDPYAIPRIEVLREDRAIRFAWKVITGRRARRTRRPVRHRVLAALPVGLRAHFGNARQRSTDGP